MLTAIAAVVDEQLALPDRLPDDLLPNGVTAAAPSMVYAIMSIRPVSPPRRDGRGRLRGPSEGVVRQARASLLA